MPSYVDRSQGAAGFRSEALSQHPVAGKQTLVEQIPAHMQARGNMVQRKEGPGDAKLLEHQASLRGTDVEIPALEGALLATRQEAVKRGLLSKASFDAGWRSPRQ